MKFAHIGDVHLGGWRYPELQQLNLDSFKTAIDICIQEKVDFLLIAGDLFDSAYPPIEVLKETFAEFRKLNDAGIKCFLIAGSHDYSVSGKTFIDIIEKCGFCEICKYEKTDNRIILLPSKFKAFEIYGYPGKKSGLEVEDIKRVEIKEKEDNFRILMLHTTITEAVGDLPIESVSLNEIPRADYYALGHLHINFEKRLGGERAAVYSGPIFPNSFQELEDLHHGRFYIVEVTGYTDIKKREIKLKEVINFNIEIKDALTATEKILSELDKQELKDKIVLLRLRGILEQGTNADINYNKIKEFLDKQGAFSFLKNTNKLVSKEKEIDLRFQEGEMDKIEEIFIEDYKKGNQSKFNEAILPLIDALNIDKQEDEKSIVYESRIFESANKIFSLNLN